MGIVLSVAAVLIALGSLGVTLYYVRQVLAVVDELRERPKAPSAGRRAQGVGEEGTLAERIERIERALEPPPPQAHLLDCGHTATEWVRLKNSDTVCRECAAKAD